ncbi:hypothetical protein EVAR_19340_1 [Eumeta japonica]|uniref:Uncharacterized protein n=1 Tax=Eumeta variegata TaxID=151549 RepID=A0A4C1TRD6_EUMVA|nr:hypothetical protein EVAR_19340_1 [Eumeta japonica]
MLKKRELWTYKIFMRYPLVVHSSHILCSLLLDDSSSRCKSRKGHETDRLRRRDKVLVLVKMRRSSADHRGGVSTYYLNSGHVSGEFEPRRCHFLDVTRGDKAGGSPRYLLK